MTRNTNLKFCVFGEVNRYFCLCQTRESTIKVWTYSTVQVTRHCETGSHYRRNYLQSSDFQLVIFVCSSLPHILFELWLIVNWVVFCFQFKMSQMRISQLKHSEIENSKEKISPKYHWYWFNKTKEPKQNKIVKSHSSIRNSM